MLYVFGAMLLITAVRLAYATASQSGSGQLTVSVPGPPGPLRRLLPAGSLLRRALPPVLALAGAIAVTDLVFAMDSIPAVFGLTRDPMMVLAVNAFALLGLRHLYYLIGGLLDRLAHLSAGLSGILAFIGVKLLIEALAQYGVTRLGPVPAAAHQHRAVVVRHRRHAGRRHRVQPGRRPAQPGPAVSQPQPAWSSRGQLGHHSASATFRVSPVSRSVSSRCPRPGRACPR